MRDDQWTAYNGSMRLISLAPSNTEILWALGLGEQIVACTNFCDWPPQAKNTHKIGGWINTEPERIQDFKPDLIFTSYFLPEPLRSWSGPGEIIHVQPKTLAEVYESIMTIGEFTGCGSQAQAVVLKMRAELESLRQERTEQQPKVYMEEWFQPTMVSGNWVPELVEIAGGTEVLAQPGQPSREFAIKELAVLDPDVMIFHWCGWGDPRSDVGGKRFDVKRVRERHGWNELRALQQGSVYFMDDSLLNRPGPRLVDGARKIHSMLQQHKAKTVSHPHTA